MQFNAHQDTAQSKFSQEYWGTICPALALTWFMSTIIQQRKPPRWLIPPSPRTRRNLLNRQCWVRAWRKPSFCHPRRSDCNWSGPANQPRWEKQIGTPSWFFVTWNINLGLTLKPKHFYRFAWFTFIRLSQEVLWLGLLHDWIPSVSEENWHQNQQMDTICQSLVNFWRPTVTKRDFSPPSREFTCCYLIFLFIFILVHLSSF